MEEKSIKTGSDFSGIGAFDQALKRLGIKQEKIFACDMDKFARESYIHNYGKPNYYPENVYNREIPKDPLDLYMTSPPCQSFSLAGKRGGESDERGVLFYNSHEFIKKNKPRFFIFENVKGLLSDQKGRTFQIWCDKLGGKSVNGTPILFPDQDSVPYHIYYKVLNAKDYNIPQNRERVFIIGIRDDSDNHFRWPKKITLEKRLKDVLESKVDKKYFLSEKMIKGLMKPKKNFKGKFIPKTGNEAHANAVTTCAGSRGTDNFIKVGYINQDTQASQVFSDQGTSPTLSAGTHGYANGYVESKIGAIRGRNPKNPKSRVSGLPTEQMLEVNEKGVSNALTTVQKDNVVVQIVRNKEGNQPSQDDRVYDTNGLSPTLDSSNSKKIIYKSSIRRLTPRECLRLMDFNDNDYEIVVSDTQAYKQAGNSIPVGVLAAIIKKLKL